MLIVPNAVNSEIFSNEKECLIDTPKELPKEKLKVYAVMVAIAKRS